MENSMQNWQIPAYSSKEYAEKTNDYCVCVFVINEGDKLLHQLERMRSICKGLADVVVADGGSTDGSTEDEKLKERGVNTLLVKTGPGKLGSQMRMAFAWALKRGYEGVVCVDGNGKDGVEAVPNFVAALKNGVDHVQGSRFIPGGHHENTPCSRLLGVKLLHAPLISLASGFRYTDTTNGFRGYSARLLSSEKIAVFRDCFTGYELHYYLAVEAARAGFTCKEIPVSRVYPPDGKVPTKISGIKGNWNIIKKLLSVCFDGYSVTHPYRRLCRLTTSFVLAIIVFIILMNMLSSLVQPSTFSPDSYATYSLSKTIFSDFYYTPLIRSYPLNCPDVFYSSSFPPLFPLMIALVNLVLPLGIYAGVFVNFLALAGIFIVIRRIFKLTLNTSCELFISSLVFLSFLNITPILGSLTSGWSQLPSIFLQMLVAYVVLGTTGKASCRRVICVAVLSGLCALNRFDWLLPALFSVVFFPLLFSERKKLHLLLSLVAFLLMISPWIIYSEARFGVLWISDNSRSVFSSVVLSPRSFYLSDSIPGYPFYAHFGQWLGKVFRPVKSLIRLMAIFSLPLSVLILGSLLRPFDELKNKVSGLLKNEKRLLLSAGFVFASYILCLGTVMLSGYSDLRYHAGMSLILSVLVIILLARAYNGFSFLSPAKTRLSYFLLLCLAFTTFLGVRSAYLQVRTGDFSKKVWAQEKYVRKKMEKYRNYLAAVNKTAKTYVSSSFEISTFEVGAFAEIPVFAHLSLSEVDGVFAKGFYERVGVEYLLSPDDENKKEFEKYYELKPVKGLPDFYQVIGVRQDAAVDKKAGKASGSSSKPTPTNSNGSPR